MDLDIKNHKLPPARPSIEEASKLKLKALPPHLRYVFFRMNETLIDIIASNLNGRQFECFVAVLKRFK